jgi:hypothetical protein
MLLLVGCAAPSSDAPLQSRAASPEQAPAPATPLDGWYEGRQLPVGQTALCRGQEKKVWFRVHGQEIEMYASRHRRSAVRHILLDGSVAADGRVVLRPQALDRSASGLIRGDQLMAADIPPEMDVVRRHSCAYRYEATRQQAE